MIFERHSQGKRLNAAFDGGSTSAQKGNVTKDMDIGAGRLEMLDSEQKHQDSTDGGCKRWREAHKCCSIGIYNIG